MAQNIQTRRLSSVPDYCVLLLSQLQEEDTHTDTMLHSDGRSISVHSAILSRASKVLANLLASGGETKSLILPGLSSVLCEFVSLVYTGFAPGLNAENASLLSSFCKDLGFKNYATDNDDENKTKIKHTHKFLTTEIKIDSDTSDESFVLRMPISRVDLSQKTVNTTHVFDAFEGRAQREYNASPVGPYEGPYDQNPAVPLCAQLPRSRLCFDEYTNFIHSEEIKCKVFKLNNTNDVDDLARVKLIISDRDSTEVFAEQNDYEKTFYTCKKKLCVIPCPCNLCSSSHQCPEHLIKHIDLFHEKDHAISVRSTELTCADKFFFFRSYILKYPGIPNNCLRCRKDLLNHKSYHLKFHWTCKFCKFFQYKLYPKSTKELNKRKEKEEAWYKSVCPHCDTRFTEPYQKRKHLEFTHGKKNGLKCDECPKMFQCKQSLEYHKLTKHTKGAPLHDCIFCDQSFLAKVTLDNHIKYTHSDQRKFECKKCVAKFKQRKHLNEHVKNIHGTNPRKEDYWQDLQRKAFSCETCEEKFTRKTDLNSHIKAKHTNQEMFSCDECHNKFIYKKNLKRHKLEKHGMDKYECPDCGREYNQKRNMERHRLIHEKSL